MKTASLRNDTPATESLTVLPRSNFEPFPEQDVGISTIAFSITRAGYFKVYEEFSGRNDRIALIVAAQDVLQHRLRQSLDEIRPPGIRVSSNAS